MDLIGNLGLVRLTLNQEPFPGEGEVIVYKNSHPLPRAEIYRLICPKKE